jgi:hypothetical protein
MTAGEPNPFVTFNDHPALANQAAPSLRATHSWAGLAVIALGTISVLSGLAGLTGGVHLLAFGSISSGGSFVVVNIARVALGMGLVMRKELARRIYVFLAVVGLVFGVLGGFLELATASGPHAVDLLAVVIGVAMDLALLALLTSPRVKREFS